MPPRRWMLVAFGLAVAGCAVSQQTLAEIGEVVLKGSPLPRGSTAPAARASTSLPAGSPALGPTGVATRGPTGAATAAPTGDPAPLARATQDRPDDAPGYQIHLLYVLASDGADRRLDTDGTIAASYGVFDDWLAGQLSAGARPAARLRTDRAGGRYDVTFVRVPKSETEIFAYGVYVRDYLEKALKDLGFNHPRKIYGVYYDGPQATTCGGGAWPPALPGTVGALYLRGTPPGAPPCEGNPFAKGGNQLGYAEASIGHEILHTMGFTPACAAHQHRSGHTTYAPEDLMWAGDAPWKHTQLDGAGEIYGHGHPDCLDLARSAFLTTNGEDGELPPRWEEAVARFSSPRDVVPTPQAH